MRHCNYPPPSHPDPDRVCPACGGLWRFHAIPPTPVSRYSTPPDIAQVRRAVEPPALLMDRRGRQHDAHGRFLPCAPEAKRHPQEGMLEAQVRAQLRRLWYASPRGCRTQLARMVGFSGAHALSSLRGLVAGRTTMLDAIRRRASRLLWAIRRGDLAIAEFLPLRQPDGRPVRRWRAVRAVPGIVVPAYRRPGRPRKGEGNGAGA